MISAYSKKSKVLETAFAVGRNLLSTPAEKSNWEYFCADS
jgi:hypothetical protein